MGRVAQVLAEGRAVALYAAVGTAATLVVYVLVRVAMLDPGTNEPLLVRLAEPAPIQDRVSEWLEDSAANTVMPIDKPPTGDVFRTNFIYGPHTINLFIMEKMPEFLVARIPDPISDMEQAWWESLSMTERNEALHELQMTIGLETEIGVNVMQGQVGASPSKTMFLQVDKYIPIDSRLSRSWFWRDVEAASRYMRVYKREFRKYYEAHRDGNR